MYTCIFFVSIHIYIENINNITPHAMSHWANSSHGSNKLVPSCLFTVSFSCLENSTTTTSNVCNSFNTENMQNNYSLFLTCNDLPWMCVKNWLISISGEASMSTISLWHTNESVHSLPCIFLEINCTERIKLLIYYTNVTDIRFHWSAYLLLQHYEYMDWKSMDDMAYFMKLSQHTILNDHCSIAWLLDSLNS